MGGNMDVKRVTFCNTCVAQRQGRPLSESEAEIHKSNHPDHDVIPMDSIAMGTEENCGVA